MKFSIVTPSFNSEKFISETIESVISQKGDFQIEYWIIDNLSKDRTREIVYKYKKMLEEGLWPKKCLGVTIQWVSEQDQGMYDAINKGFSMASGDFFAWINSDDVYLPGAFNAIAMTFDAFEKILWLKGITSYIDENSIFYKSGECYLYNQEWIQMGHYGRYHQFIQQDSVFWRSDLWKKVGGINPKLKWAGDYSLWVSFAQSTPLYSIKVFLSCFRKIQGQLSQDIQAYRQEMAQITPHARFKGKIIEYYFSREVFFPKILRPFLYRVLFGKHLHHLIVLDDDGRPLLSSGSYYDLNGQV